MNPSTGIRKLEGKQIKIKASCVYWKNKFGKGKTRTLVPCRQIVLSLYNNIIAIISKMAAVKWLVT